MSSTEFPYTLNQIQEKSGITDWGYRKLLRDFNFEMLLTEGIHFEMDGKRKFYSEKAIELIKDYTENKPDIDLSMDNVEMEKLKLKNTFLNQHFDFLNVMFNDLQKVADRSILRSYTLTIRNCKLEVVIGILMIVIGSMWDSRFSSVPIIGGSLIILYTSIFVLPGLVKRYREFLLDLKERDYTKNENK